MRKQKKQGNAIHQLITSTDKENDEMVYELYGLTTDERKIVEGAQCYLVLPTI
jgi:hypothetical protein